MAFLCCIHSTMLLQNLGSSFYILIFADPENRRGLCADFYHGFGPTPNHFLCLGPVMLHSKKSSSTALKTCLHHLFSSFIYWHLWHGHVWEHHSTWDLQKHNGWCFRGSSPDQFLACANPIAHFPKMTWPHNLRIVVEPPAPFLGF